ncbi:unnamed protein product [Medioppia subpectinata]|uniref:Uncharacterized protein n=1 Tax=Medioppia subpectinata TaxID=1979941 RepID=A0A7R9KD53_9ACAR|nr:unnamed protein product [Medioppia subpectinata]CAG2101048.1 unnamed protein product [Medioppia subpectinata]
MAEPNDSSLAFFSKATPKQWSYIWAKYSEVLSLKAEERNRKKGGPQELIKLDNWYQEHLPQKIHSRKDPHIIHEELVQIAKWKLMRGKYRPKLLDLVRINTELAVLTISKKAFRKMYHQKNLSQAINALITLKGIGPATASAVLSAAYPEQAPFMADECMLSTPGVEANDYTLAEYNTYSEQIKNCAEKLKQSDPDFKWTPHKVDQALWAHYLARELKPEIIDGMPAADGSERNVIKNTSEEDSVDTTDITSAIPTLPVLNGKAGTSLSDENSSGPSSEVEDKSNDSLHIPHKKYKYGNGNGNIGTIMNGEDSKDLGSECVESEDSRIMASEENSVENGSDVSLEPALKKQRVDATELSAVAVGEDAQL